MTTNCVKPQHCPARNLAGNLAQSAKTAVHSMPARAQAQLKHTYTYASFKAVKTPRGGVTNPEATLMTPLVSRGWCRWARRWRRRLGRRAPVPRPPTTARTCMCRPKDYMRRRCRQSTNKPVCVLLSSTVLMQADTQCSCVQRL